MLQFRFKKISEPILITLLVMMITLQNCNSNEKPEILADIDNCLECGMVISQVNQGSGFYRNNEFNTFCSPVCLLKRYQSIENKARPAASQIYFADYPTTDLMSSDSVVFLLTEHITTVMNSGTLTFQNLDEASSYQKKGDEILTNWRGFQIMRGIADKKIEVRITSEGLDPDVILLNKNEIIEWIFLPQDPDIHDLFQLKGYEEMATIEILAGGAPVVMRMLADKPGEGFPLIRASDNKTLGMVKVMGAHTSDEEVM